MKKFLSLCLAFLLAIGLTACGNNDEEQLQAAQDVVTGYFDALQAGDWDKAESYISDAYTDPLGIDNMEEYVDDLLSDLDLGDTFDAQAREFIDNVLKGVISSYKITDARKDGDTVIVSVDVTGKDYEGIDFSDMESELTEYATNYATENQERLAQVYSEQGEAAAMDVIMQDIGKYMFDRMETLFTDAQEKSYKAEFEVSQDDGEWKMTHGSMDEE